MKNFKRIIIVLVVVVVLVGGLFGAYKATRQNKVAKVVPISDYAMSEYWGDSIESYGSVEADKAQMVFLSDNSKIDEVFVSEGDTVEEGQVLLSVKVDSKDIVGKKLEVQKAAQSLNVSKRLLAKYQKAKPAPEADKIQTKEVMGGKLCLASVEYKALMDIACDPDDPRKTILAGEVAAVEYFDYNEELTSTTYTYDAIKDYDLKDASVFEPVVNREIYEWVSTIEYYDGDGNLLGQDIFEMDGSAQSLYEIPTGYTAKELEELIGDTAADIKRKDLDYRKMVKELDLLLAGSDDGQIKATYSGKVTALQDKDNINDNMPFITVAASDEFYVEGNLGEYNLGDVSVGDTINVNSWETGIVAEGTIVSIDDYPSDEDSFNDQDLAASQYGFKATIDTNCGMQIGEAVNISIDAKAAEKGFYLENSLVKKDSSGSFVMIRDENNRLQKSYVTCGKSLWGSYIQILSGVTMDDYIAFPYGNGAIEGAKCEETDSLYEY